MNTRKKSRASPRGRSGGRGGGSGYDFQDLYVAYQLAKLLVGDRDQPLEVVWEKKALDRGRTGAPDPVHVDDAILHLTSGKWIHVQVKESVPPGGWTVAQLLSSGVGRQFWRQWSTSTVAERTRTFVRLASCGDLRALTALVDVALRSRTPMELLSDEASADTADEIAAFAASLGLTADSGEFLAFLKSIQAEPLCTAHELEGWIIQNLALFGHHAADLARRLIRFVGRSKHAGSGARSSFTRETLVRELRDDGFPEDPLIAAGLLRAESIDDHTLWDWYRSQIVKKFRSFRVYGLQVDRAVYADLPALFVPLKLAVLPRGEALNTDPKSPERGRKAPSLAERLSSELENEDSRERDAVEREDVGKGDGLDVTKVLSQNRRFALVSGPGTGKTTTLKWIAVVSALSDAEGERQRIKVGLPAEPLVPVYVRFRQFAERVTARGLGGVEGRVGLVADFLAAELEAGMVGRIVSRVQALQMAQEILERETSLLLFDGLDEVADESMRTRLFEAVGDLIRTYKAPRVIVASRPYAFKRERSPLDLALFRPLPLDREARRSFAHQWYRAVRTTLGDSLEEAEARLRADDLARAAESLTDLAEVPLLLSILALVHFNRQGLPLERATLYDHATLAMLGHWERDPAGRDLGEEAIPSDWARRLHLGEKEIRRVVEHLAYRIQVREGGGEFDSAAAIDGLSDGLNPSSSVEKEEAFDQAQLLLRLLVDRAGLVQERSPNVFAFVHLSFQEYLTARWFVGRGSRGIEQLADLAEEDGHAEVLRLACAILAADQRTEADERVTHLIHAISTKNPVLAAACLLEAPRTRVAELTAEQLAIAVYSDCTDPSRHYLPPRVTARLVWVLLALTRNADRILLTMLANPGGGWHPRDFPPEFMDREFADREFRHRRRFRHFEDGYVAIAAVLGARPARPMTAQLAWVLRRLAAMEGNRPDTALGPIATLLLIEAGVVQPADYAGNLVSLLANEHREEGRLADRAKRLLRLLWEHPNTRSAVTEALRGALVSTAPLAGARDRQGAWAAARFLLGLGEPATPEIVEALIEGGFYTRSRHSQVSSDLRALAADSATRAIVVTALINGVASQDSDVRSGSSRLLTELGIVVPGSAGAAADDEDDVSRLTQLAVDPATAQRTLGALAEDLWAEDDSTAWHAANALIAAGEPATPGVAYAVVNAGLASKQRRSAALEYLRGMRREPHLDVALRAALLSALSSSQDGVATTAALLLLEFEKVNSPRRLTRLLAAAFRDSDQFSDVEPHVRSMVADSQARSVVLESIGKYLGGNTDRRTVRSVVRILADAGCMHVSNLAKELVEHGLSNASDHEEVIGYLKRMLEEPELVTPTRRLLSDALSSNNRDVAWGAARCLWEAGSRTDSKLAATLATTGLEGGARREQARGWLLELLGNPTTAKFARGALERATRRVRDTPPGYDLAWSAAECLISGTVLQAEDLAAALVIGGLHRRDDHAKVLNVISELMARDTQLAAEIHEVLWDALEDKDPDVRWGVAKLLIQTGKASTLTVVRSDTTTFDDDRTRQGEREGDRVKALARFWAILIKESDAPEASAGLEKLQASDNIPKTQQQALTELLKDDDTSVALAAAHYLLNLGGSNVLAAMEVTVARGLADGGRNGESAKILGQLLSRPDTAPAAKEALNRALWSSDENAAWYAATYLFERGERLNPGIPRGLIYGGLLSRRSRDAERWVRVLLANDDNRAATLDALGAALYSESEARFRAAGLLVEFGAPVHERVLVAFGSMARWQPWVPLAILALSERIDEVRETATRFGLTELRDVIGSEQQSSIA